jgi:hypothetical protein
MQIKKTAESTYINNHPTGENSPNLVTLMLSRLFTKIKLFVSKLAKKLKLPLFQPN